MINKKNSQNAKIEIMDVLIIFIMIVVVIGIILLSIKFKNSKKEVKTEQNISQSQENENIEDSEELSKEDSKVKIEEKKKVVYDLPEWTDTAVQDIKDIYGSDEKQVFLTFDDGPSPEVTPKILEVLKEEDVTATFFVLGKCIKLYPELLKQEYEAGYFIANHGYSHTYSQIYSSVDSVVDEYNRTNEEIAKAIGIPEYNSHLFRFPGGSSGGPYDSLKAQAKKYLAEHEIASTNWNCLTSDAAGNHTVQAQYKGALDTQGNKTSLIILMHDAADKSATPETLKLLIKHYKEEGYEFKNFYDIFKKKEVESDLENENIKDNKTGNVSENTEIKEKDNKSSNKVEKIDKNNVVHKVDNNEVKNIKK